MRSSVHERAEHYAGEQNILSDPEDKPWRLREFTVADLDGNQLRVFYDFSSDLPRYADRRDQS